MGAIALMVAIGATATLLTALSPCLAIVAAPVAPTAIRNSCPRPAARATGPEGVCQRPRVQVQFSAFRNSCLRFCTCTTALVYTLLVHGRPAPSAGRCTGSCWMPSSQQGCPSSKQPRTAV